MQHCSVVAVLFAFISFVTPSYSQDVHPVVGVIDLLKTLKTQVRSEGQAEEATYQQFATWCSTSEDTLNQAIATSKEQIEVLESTIASKTAENETLTNHIAALTAEIAEYQAAATQAQAERNDAAALYATADADLDTTITAIDGVITALESTQSTTEANAAAAATQLVQSKMVKLLQLPLLLEKLTDSQAEALSALTGRGHQPAPAPASYEDLFAKGDFAAHQKTYDFKSGNVIDLLKELKIKFEDDRVEGTKAETNSQNEYAVASTARTNAETAATTAQGETQTLLSQVQQDIVTAQGSLTDAESTLATDSTSLSDTQRLCNEKKSEWAERTEIRAKEVEAITAAIEILGKVTGVRTEQPSNPVPPPSPISFFLSVNKTLPKLSTITLFKAVHSDPKQRAVKLIRKEAQARHSRALAQFAEQVAAHLTGPFDEVNNMIQKMIFRLMAEQTDEDEHKNWCDLEMNKTNISEDEKLSRITQLTLKIDAGKASVQQLDNEITTATTMVTTLDTHIAQATEIRQQGKGENEVAIEDAKKAQKALAQATAVLEKFYKDTGMMTKEAWELIQRQPTPVTLPAEPSTWSSSYTGVADPKDPSGVVTLLNTVAAEFAQMQADTEAQEAIDQKNYEEEMKDCRIEKARSAKEAEMKEQEKQRTAEKVAAMEKNLNHVQKELGALRQYWKDLGPACREGDSTYEVRKAARAAEITALKEAQVILADAFKNGTAAAPAPAAAFLAPVQRRVAY